MPDYTLSGLVDQNRLARETFYKCKDQVFSPFRRLSVATLHARTEDAELAWQKAEHALWKYRAFIAGSLL